MERADSRLADLLAAGDVICIEVSETARHHAYFDAAIVA